MKTYTTTTGQNIFDVCLALYGSVEGILDLFVCNTSLEVEGYGPQELKGQPLTYDTKLSRGVILKYNEGIDINSDVMEYIEENGLKAAHGEHVPSANGRDIDKCKMLVYQTGKTSTIKVSVSAGEMVVDWGDFSETDTVTPDDGITELEHVYPKSENHTVTVYGDFECGLLDLDSVNGTVYPTDEIKVSELKYNAPSETLLTLFKTDKI